VSATTLDVIGLAGFDYNFNSLSGDGNELAKASAQMTVDASTVTIWQAAEYFFPVLLSLVSLPTSLRRIDIELTYNRRISLQSITKRSSEFGYSWIVLVGKH
jgi:hypothetical protein